MVEKSNGCTCATPQCDVCGGSAVPCICKVSACDCGRPCAACGAAPESCFCTGPGAFMPATAATVCPSCGGADQGASCDICAGGLVMKARCTVCRCLGYEVPAVEHVPFLRGALCPSCFELYQLDGKRPANPAGEPWTLTYGNVTEARAAQLGHSGRRRPAGAPLLDHGGRRPSPMVLDSILDAVEGRR
jgi:hypothetical protein